MSIFHFLCFNFWILIIPQFSIPAVYQCNMLPSNVFTSLAAAFSTLWLAEPFLLLWLIEMISLMRFVARREFPDKLVGVWKMNRLNGSFGWQESSRSWVFKIWFACMIFFTVP